MSGYNPHRQPLNSWSSMFSLGNQPKIPGQCKQNLRFIDQDSANPRNRYRLRRAFGNQLFNISTHFTASKVILSTTSNEISYNSVPITQNVQISQFNRSKTEFVFKVQNSSDLSFDQVTSVSINNTQEFGDINILGPPNIVDTDHTHVTLSISDNTGEFRSGLTPFRKAFNAGDMLTRNNSATSTLLPKPPNQVNSLRNMFGWQNNAGSVGQDSNGSFYSGNPRFVYDGSDYSRFKKLQAINRNYNDITFGGDQHSASQQAYRRVV